MLSLHVDLSLFGQMDPCEKAEVYGVMYAFPLCTPAATQQMPHTRLCPRLCEVSLHYAFMLYVYFIFFSFLLY